MITAGRARARTWITHLHVMKLLPVAQVAKRLDVQDAQIYFEKHQVGVMMRREIKRLERPFL